MNIFVENSAKLRERVLQDHELLTDLNEQLAKPWEQPEIGAIQHPRFTCAREIGPPEDDLLLMVDSLQQRYPEITAPAWLNLEAFAQQAESNKRCGYEGPDGVVAVSKGGTPALIVEGWKPIRKIESPWPDLFGLPHRADNLRIQLEDGENVFEFFSQRLDLD